MSNYNIDIDLLKLEGAKVQDIQGNAQTRKCVCIPIDNRAGTVTDTYFARGKGGLIEMKKKGVVLSLTAFEIRDDKDGQSHLIKPHLSREFYDNMTETERRQVRWIGNLRPWNPDGGNKGGNW